MKSEVAGSRGGRGGLRRNQDPIQDKKKGEKGPREKKQSRRRKTNGLVYGREVRWSCVCQDMNYPTAYY